MQAKHYPEYAQYVKEQAEQFGIPVIHAAEYSQLSFTPYISNACSARCRFCSEKLTRAGCAVMQLKVCEGYREKLIRAFLYQRETPMFLSLSGMEPSESADQLALVRDAVLSAQAQGCTFTEKVMYSNLSGFTKRRAALLQVLRDLELTRIECSRHHYSEEINQKIVRFRSGESIRSNSVFASVVQSLLPVVQIRMVCVMQKTGICDPDGVIEYLKFAQSIGVKDVVFRELAVFSDAADNDMISDYITANRVEMMDVLQALPSKAFERIAITEGYYYYSFVYRFEDMQVSFEMSDYNQMIRKHYGDRLYKLIFYSNGDLCRDWNMKGVIPVEEQLLCCHGEADAVFA